MGRPTRRAFIGAFGTLSVAGCLGTSGNGSSESAGEKGPPVADRTLPLPDDTEQLSEAIVETGVPKDGIPSIDEPQFLDAEPADEWLEDGEPVFGVERDGETRAYPQRILVSHEIVNDVLAGENLSITYCPLTGTVQGFERGDTEFGVSGWLLNSNLVMYDRATESYWPQMLATSIQGDYENAVLREFSVVWTTWERWQETYPHTAVLSRDTGYARDYEDDPYGSYNPPAGFYTSDSLLYDPYSPIDETERHKKDVVIGARSADGALAVDKESLAAAGVLETTVGDVPHVAVYGPALDTGYIYRNPEQRTVSEENGATVVDGETYDPDELPLEEIVCYDAFWFAWAGYYPDTKLLT